MINGIKDYFIGARKEFRAITWPTLTETRQLTMIVLGLSIGFAAFLGLADYLFLHILETFVKSF